MDDRPRDLASTATRASGGGDFLLPVRRQSPRYLTIGEWWNISDRANQAYMAPSRRTEPVTCHRDMNIWCVSVASLLVTTGLTVKELLVAKPGLVLAPEVELHGDVWMWLERLLRRRRRVGIRGPHFPLFCSVLNHDTGAQTRIEVATRRLSSWAKHLKTGRLTWKLLARTDEGTNVIRSRLSQRKRETLLRMAGVDG